MSTVQSVQEKHGDNHNINKYLREIPIWLVISKLSLNVIKIVTFAFPAYNNNVLNKINVRIDGKNIVDVKLL